MGMLTIKQLSEVNEILKRRLFFKERCIIENLASDNSNISIYINNFRLEKQIKSLKNRIAENRLKMEALKNG